MHNNLLSICDHFLLPRGQRTVEPYGNGHINDTYLLTIDADGGTRRFILQRLNRYVFSHPAQVIENIARVTAHLYHKIAQSGGDPMRETLTLVQADDDMRHYVDENGDYYRIYLFIEHTVWFDLPDTPQLFERSARSFGRFQMQLADFPAVLLHETIINFHNTPERFQQLTRAIREDRAGRLASASAEIDFAHGYEREVHRLTEANMPLRVTHNDTKLNNILMDKSTGEGVCVIDLDTVMPGLAAYDFGDAIRFGANTAAEDEEDLSKVRFSLPMYEAYAHGYLQEAGPALTPQEIAALPLGAKLMTLECGLRFLADHLNGDVYFKIHKPNHNLIRARNQFALVRDMQNHWPAMQSIIQKEASTLK